MRKEEEYEKGWESYGSVTADVSNWMIKTMSRYIYQIMNMLIWCICMLYFRWIDRWMDVTKLFIKN